VTPWLTSLRVRLSLLVLVALLPALALVLFDARQDYHWREAELRRTAGHLVELATLEEQERVNGARQLLLALSQSEPVRRGDAARCTALVSSLRQELPRYANIGVIQTNGDIFASAVPLREPINAAAQEYFQVALRERRFAIGGYQIGRLTGKPVIAFAQPVLNESGGVQAVVYATLDLHPLNTSESRVARLLPAGAVFTMIDDDGAILVRLPDPEGWLGKPLPDPALVREIFTGSDGVREAHDAAGRPTVQVHSRIRSPLYTGEIGVLLEMPREAVFGALDREHRRNLLALALTGVLAWAAAWRVGERLVVRPARALVAMAERIATGDLSARPPASHGHGELNQLGAALGQMAATLERHEAERDRATVVLRASEAEQRALLTALPDVVLVLDDEGRYLKIQSGNPALLYRPPLELVGRTLHEVLPKAKADEFLGYVHEALRQNQALPIEYTLPMGGREMFFAGAAVPLTGKTVVWFVRDVTAQKWAETKNAALLALATRLNAVTSVEEAARAFVEAAEPLFRWDACLVGLYSAETDRWQLVLRIDTLDGRKTTVPWNEPSPPGALMRQVLREGAQLVLRESPDEAVDGLIPFGDTSRRSASLMFAPMRNGGRVVGVVSVQSYTPRIYTADDLAVLQALADQCSSAIEHARSQEALRESEERFAAAFYANPAGVCITTCDEGRFLDVNGAFLRIVGRPREQIIGRTPVELGFYPSADDRRQVTETIKRAGSVRDLEVSFIRADGTKGHTLRSVERITVGGQDCLLSLIIDITERKQAEEQLQVLTRQLRGLASRIQSAREAERTRLAREIHDVLAQELTRLKLDLLWLSRRLGEPVDEARRPPLLEKVRAMTGLTDAAIGTVQHIATELRPVVLDRLGLAAAIEWQTQEFQRQTAISCETALSAQELSLGCEVDTAFFRILQESLTNVTRHAQATRVTVSLDVTPGAVTMTVRDNGRGLQRHAGSDPYSLGLTGMRERALAVGARFDITGAPGAGTTVTVSLPRSERPPDSAQTAGA